MVAALSFISIAYLFIDLSSSTIEKNRVTCCVTHKRTGIFCQGVWWTICPKISFKLPKFLWNSWKETRVIRCTDNGLHMKWKYFYVWIYHMSPKNTLKLKEIAVGVWLFNAMLLTRCCPMVLRAEVSFHSAQRKPRRRRRRRRRRERHQTKGFYEQHIGCARAFWISVHFFAQAAQALFVHFFAVHYKTTTWNG